MSHAHLWRPAPSERQGENRAHCPDPGFDRRGAGGKRMECGLSRKSHGTEGRRGMTVRIGWSASAPDFQDAAKVSLENAQLRHNVRHATDVIRAKRAKVVNEVPDWEQLRDAASPSRPIRCVIWTATCCSSRKTLSAPGAMCTGRATPT